MPSLYFAYGSNLCLPRLRHRVPGVRARGVADEKPLLERVEELGTGYHQMDVTVESTAGITRAWTYVAAPDKRDDSLRPYGWYRDLVAFGARSLALPEDYVRALHAVASLDDPDPVRARRERAFLANLSGGGVRP